MTRQKSLISKLISPSGFLSLLRRPERIVNYARFVTEDVRGVTVRKEVEAYKGAGKALGELASLLNVRSLEPVTLEQFFPQANSLPECAELAALFEMHGSDKSSLHDYHLIYGSILKGMRQAPLKILEVGLGTNNTDTPSNMGAEGSPGASLRSFRDWAPHAKVYGADVDTRILFSEERIETFFVDQTDPKALSDLARRFPTGSFDLIIDDGLHTPLANFYTIAAMLPLVSASGYLIIEDIAEIYLPVWRAAVSLLSQSCDCQLLQTKSALACIIAKKKIA